MGTFTIAIDIGDPQGQRWETVEALVDTGSSFTWMPRAVLEALGVQPESRWEFETADGRIIEREMAQTRARLDGQERITIVIFAEAGDSVLLGAYTLEGFLLAPDPVNQRLVRVRGLAMSGRTNPTIQVAGLAYAVAHPEPVEGVVGSLTMWEL